MQRSCAVKQLSLAGQMIGTRAAWDRHLAILARAVRLRQGRVKESAGCYLPASLFATIRRDLMRR